MPDLRSKAYTCAAPLMTPGAQMPSRKSAPMPSPALNHEQNDDQSDGTVRLWLSQRQWMSALERIERQARQVRFTGDNQRQSPRLPAPHEARCLIRLGHTGPRQGTYLVQLRNISATGLGFLTAATFEPKTRCTVALQDSEGHGLICAASVVWCKELRENLHAVGIQFDQPVDPDRFFTEAPSDISG